MISDQLSDPLRGDPRVLADVEREIARAEALVRRELDLRHPIADDGAQRVEPLSSTRSLSRVVVEPARAHDPRVAPPPAGAVLSDRQIDRHQTGEDLRPAERPTGDGEGPQPCVSQAEERRVRVLLEDPLARHRVVDVEDDALERPRDVRRELVDRRHPARRGSRLRHVVTRKNAHFRYRPSVNTAGDG